MARRRKNETKASTKSPLKFVAVRKSSRQIAKKQVEGKKVNGETTQLTDSEESRASQDEQNQSNLKRIHKKFGKYKCPVNSDKEIISDGIVNDAASIIRYNRDAGESDSQDIVENSIGPSEKLSPEDVRQVVVGISHTNESNVEPLNASTSHEVTWQEDVIEETIICEEMEVEEEPMDNSYTIAQDGSVVLEQVLVVNEPDFEGKGVVEFTVIQNEDGTESMVLASGRENASTEIERVGGSASLLEQSNINNSESKDRCQEADKYRIIEEGVSNLHMIDSKDISCTPCKNKNGVPSDMEKSDESPYNFEVNEHYEKSTVPVNKEFGCIKNPEGTILNSSQIIAKKSTTKSSHLTLPCSLKEDLNASVDYLEENNSRVVQCSNEQEGIKLYNSQLEQKCSNSEDTLSEICTEICKLDSDLAVVKMNETSKEISDLINDLSDAPEEQNLLGQNNSFMCLDKLSPSIQDSGNTLSVLHKLDHRQLPISNDLTKSSHTAKINESIVHGNVLNERKSISAVQVDQQRNTDHSQHIEELSRDSEMDGKADIEDIKLSSSSENSNDTLLSINGCKILELGDVKNITNQQNEADKKVGFRSRSGSTDTTGSESGSNSSGVRRSSRIRSIGLMKQRSHGRGLVTKPNLDLSRAVFQHDRDKSTNSTTVSSQELKDNSDNQSETQSDKESNSNKTITPLDSPVPLATITGFTGYDSDSSKPVKVKSRWRRSSELEMGGSGSGSSSGLGIGPGCGLISGSGTVSTTGFGHGTGSVLVPAPIPESESESGSVLVTTQMCSETDVINEIFPALGNSHVSTSVPSITNTIGVKIPSSMIPEIKDKEMDDRLSQFDHLSENLYLTERYTNKETKRMVCDCFLTEEEIERGELGCGEDCLNRLLMIECGSRCVVGDRCTNKRFQNCEYAKCEVFRTEKKGLGLRAVIDLFAGEFIMEYVGEVVDPKDFRRRAKEYSKDKNKHYYFMALKSDQIIDATMKGNVSRFINHSCDPNSETQKWTVNGELRIGFFIKKFIAAGEEITFDYHFQRYGKEAQKCFCEASNCRGWIGETPEEEKEKIEKKEKREKDAKKKKEEKKPIDYMEDEDLEEEIDKLCSGGLKNRAHTLTLSRLMVRSRELEHRTRLLRVIQSGEQPCRRLFLDYHGLRLIWSYMMDITTNESEEAQQFRLEILKTLSTLPIPNKTMLMDSKVYSVVEKWAKRLYLLPSGGSPEDEQIKSKINSEEPDSSCDSNDKTNIEPLNEISDKEEKKIEGTDGVGDVKQETVEQTFMSELASTLLVGWSNLKEVFRIPKKERIEQMKEHEREADQGYKEVLEKEERREASYDRHRSDRYGRNEIDKRADRRRGRESPDTEHSKTKDKRAEERGNLVPIPRLTKFERRQLFALKVAKEEEERQRRQQQESWQEHEARCLALGMDPQTTAAFDTQTGYPLFFNPSLGQWQPYPMQDGGEITQQCTPVYIGGPQTLPGHPMQTGIMPANPHILPPPGIPPGISPGISPGIPPGVLPSVYPMNQSTAFNQSSTPYAMLPHHQQFPNTQLQMSTNLIPIHSGTPPISIQGQPLYIDKTAEPQFPTTTCTESTSVPTPPPPEIPPLDLPPKWKWAKDARGRTYYYHIKDRVSQWLPPPPDHIGVNPGSSSSSESSDESSSSDEEEEDPPEDRNDDRTNEDMDVDSNLTDSLLSNPKISAMKNVDSCITANSGLTVIPELKKRRDGLVQERIISPRREDDRVDHKKYKEIKDKLRRQKERAKLKEHVEKLKKYRRSNKSKSHSRHSLNKLQSISADASSTSERKIKDAFRINMANVMVHFLNPYRKNDCKQGRITNTEDFKHLARKLTHFVLAKELKHCKSVDELQCNDNVKHKAKDFVRKYMNKFGAVYQKATDED